ncbi:GMC family oxidoreductase [Sphingomonas parva]|uniref:GMC family oxidoreductase n=1 Tax=Sphingomonas parva TaxID=2555898 RepID=A0A4Y8ZK25_9SPHN|nr:GMC family oxidoreductase [Sphingomonas parva]TFI56328.1 GMC family oxidoreductase [Sphingomonas parva]
MDADVIVVGSGVGGSMAAYALGKAGVKVAMFEAGRHYDPESETPMMNWDREAPLRAVGTPDKPFGYYDATVDGGWQVPGEPYTVADGSTFTWWRSRMLGGRTNHWARHVPRFGPLDFKPYSRDGLGVDWPIDYDEIKPWYDRAERLMGVIGENIDLPNVPPSPASVRQPPPVPRVPELLLKAACDDLGIPCIAPPRAVITRPIDGRDACFYASPCDRGCSIRANFQAVTVLLPPALATGNVTVTTDAMVAEVLLDQAGKANGIRYVDKKTGEWREARAKAVVLAASACESARILLNSKSGNFPNGLGNSSGQVGRNLMDTVGFGMGARVPALEGRPRYNEDGISFAHVYMPWWQDDRHKELGFPRGYHLEVWGDWTKHPGMGHGWNSLNFDGFGPGLREHMRRSFGTTIGMAGRGEMIPNDDCFCELDPQVKDRWGIPVLRFHWKWSEHEIRQAEHMRSTMLRIFDRIGAKLDNPKDAEGPVKISAGGEMIHEVGTARMGGDRKSSVVDPTGQAWDVPGLWLMDGSVLPSNPDKNPTLTIMALAWRSSVAMLKASKGARA